MKLNSLLLFVIVGMISFVLVGHADKGSLSYYRDFWSPMYHDKPLNYCLLNDKKQCGDVVADIYCKKMGYDNSTKSIIAHNVGYTIFMDGCKGCKLFCKGWNCNGFKLIRCINDLTHSPAQSYYFRTQTFVYPRYKKYRVDWCYQNGQACGKRVANSFCKRMGYMQEKGFAIDRDVNATRALGNSKLCFGNDCLAFSSITCYR